VGKSQGKPREEVAQDSAEDVGSIQVGRVTGAGNDFEPRAGDLLRHVLAGSQEGRVALAHHDQRGDADQRERVDHRRVRLRQHPAGRVREALGRLAQHLRAAPFLDHLAARMRDRVQLIPVQEVTHVLAKDRATYEKFLASMVERTDIVPYAVIDKTDNKAKGHLWLMEIRPAHGVFEVGWITYAPALQRTRAATEAVYLIGDYGFSLGYRRYEWKCNNRNEPSKRAALRYGFKYEGLFRQHQIVKGQNRDTAWYSMLDGEWPGRKAAFESWLAPANFSPEGRQKAPLEAFRS